MSNQPPPPASPVQLADELNNFQEIAKALRPSSGDVPVLKGIEISGFSMPLHGASGGDHVIYIDFNKRYDLPARIAEAEGQGRRVVARNLRRLRGRGGILVADVAGHLVTDAVIAAMLHQAFLLGAYYELDMFGEITTRIFEHINTRFYRTSSINKYFTMIYGEISEEGKFRFLSAGHQPPAVFSREYGRFMPISADRLLSFQPVGMLPSDADTDERRDPRVIGYKKKYAVNEINLLATGDVLLLYTDGFSDHAGGAFFPEEVERSMARLRDEPPARICEELRRELLARAEPTDDVTLVAIKKTR